MKNILVLIIVFNCFTLFLRAQTDTIYRNLTVVQADSLIQAHPADTNFIILDVRQAGPYAAGHLQNAINIDYYAPNFSTLIAALDHSKIYLVHCQSGGRSAATFAMMQTQHFREVYNMLGGMNAWLGAGYPVVTATGISETKNENYRPLIFPNPLIESSVIDLNDKNIKSGEILIFNITGQKIKEFSINSDLIRLNRNNLESGTYFFMIKTDNQKVITGDFLVK